MPARLAAWDLETEVTNNEYLLSSRARLLLARHHSSLRHAPWAFVIAE